jgi:hypothetical protein
MKFPKVLITFLVLFVFKVSGQMNITCPDDCLSAPDIDMNKFLGVWFLQRYSLSFVDETMKCGYWEVTKVEGYKVYGTFNLLKVG